jgi:thiol-disulfide isomerase/thioredoxin
MATTNSGAGARLLTALGLAAACAVPAWAAGNAPSAAVMLKYKPSQEGVAYSIPKPEEEAGLKVELVKGAGGAAGWMLKDAGGRPMRLFYDSNGDNKPDLWAYYKDGVEVYREFEAETKNALGKPDQFRWLNAGGMKWGVDEAKEGRIKAWKAISAQEASQEALQALATKDFARYQMLLISEAELKSLDLPAEQANRIKESLKAAAAKFQKTLADLQKFGPKVGWVHLDAGAPQCTPADATGGPPRDVLRHANAAVLYESNGASDYVQLGEMILVGQTWRLTAGPAVGAAADPVETADGSGAKVSNPEVLKLVEELTKLDQQPPDATATGANAQLARHHLARVDLLEKIAGKLKSEERDPWLRQIADSLSTAAQSAGSADSPGYKRLVAFVEQTAKAAPGSTVAAYAAYREMQADYSIKLANGVEFKKVQEGWRDRLTKFVDAFPKADDAPEALLQLGVVNEFLDKDVDAKNWYAQVGKRFADKPQAAKAAGAVRRLEMEGQPLKLAGPTLQDANVAFDVDQLRGKVVVVYYWASWNTHSDSDFAKLKALVDTNKGVEVVCVNLDNTAKEAKEYLARVPAPGVHLHQNGGLEGRLATDYGVMGLPNLFLVGKDGKVVSRNAQINGLDDEVKKLLK